MDEYLNKEKNRFEKEDYIENQALNDHLKANENYKSQTDVDFLRDARIHAADKYGEISTNRSGLFLWEETKEGIEGSRIMHSISKYSALSDKTNQNLVDYSSRFTNHSARKRAGYSKDAKKQYQKYDQKMAQLRQQKLAFAENAPTDQQVQKFFKETLSALDIRQKAMINAAKVKSTSSKNEAFRIIKIKREILGQKANLAYEYYNKYAHDGQNVLADFFQAQIDEISQKLSSIQSEYESKYYQTRGDAMIKVEAKTVEDLGARTRFEVLAPTSKDEIELNKHVNPKLKSVRQQLDSLKTNGANTYATKDDVLNNIIEDNDTTVTVHDGELDDYADRDDVVLQFEILGTKDTLEDYIPTVDQYKLMAKTNMKGDYEKYIKLHHLEDNAASVEIYARALYDHNMTKRFGKNYTSDELKDKTGIRSKSSDEGNMEKITMQGADVFDIGKYDIESNSQAAIDIAAIKLVPLFNQWRNDPTLEPTNIHISMHGVSRGGINVTLACMAINGWVAQNYPEYAPYLKFTITQFDPVPGPTLRTEHDSVRYGGTSYSSQELDENGFIKGTNYKPLAKENSNTTVFYSMHPNMGSMNAILSPQKVFGANRIILSPRGHTDDFIGSTGPIKMEGSEANSSQQKEEYLYNNANKEYYTSLGTCDLEDGVYIIDEYNTLTKMKSYEDVKKVFLKCRDDKLYSRRENRILEVIKDWFDNHKEVNVQNQ